MNNNSIKDIITQYPQVGEFLKLNGVDCANCLVGTCLLKDILTIHNYNEEVQEEIYSHIDKLISGESDEMIIFEHVQEEIALQPIIKKLMDQHQIILQIVYTIEFITSQKYFNVKFEKELKQLLEYVSNYADKQHHLLEEDTLFKDYQNEAINVMFEEHDMGRNYIKQAKLNFDDEDILKENLLAYTNLLKDHIHKEDTILFPYLNTICEKDYQFTTNQAIEDEVVAYLSDFNNKLFTI